MKKTLFLFRLFALVATLTCALSARADYFYYDNYYSSGVYYDLYQEEYAYDNWGYVGTFAVVSEGPGNFLYSGDVTISSSVYYNGKTYPVRGIDDYAFARSTGLTSVTIPNSVVAIRTGAFYGCTGLTSITIPASVEKICLQAFYGCTNLKSITCSSPTPPSFYDPDDSFEEDEELFPFSDVTYTKATLYVPKGSKSAYQETGHRKYWYKFRNIVELTYDFEVNGIYYAITGSNTVEVTYKDDNLNTYSGSVSIPSSVIYNGKTYQVTSIGYAAFAACSDLTSVTVPNTVTVIDTLAFAMSTSLTSIAIPNSVATIRAAAFSGCSALTRITIPASVTRIGEYAFSECTNLNYVTSLSTTPPTMDNSNVFSDNTYYSATLTVPCSSKSAYQSATGWKNFVFISTMYDFVSNGIYYVITGSNTVEATYKDTNYNTYSGSVNIPSSVSYGGTTYQVTRIGDAAFGDCSNLTSVTIPSTVTSIGYFAFMDCSKLANVTIPNSVTDIGNYAFSYCTKFTSITIPNSVTDIGPYAFSECSQLQTLVIGASVYRIGEEAFDGCTGLRYVTCLATTPPTMASSSVFSSSTYSSATLTVLKGCKSTYQTANWWKNFTSIQELPYSFVVNGIYYAITGNSTVEVSCKDSNYNNYSGDILIPNMITYNSKNYNVTGIGNNAFRACSGLTSVVIPYTVTTIGNNAFYGCTGLTHLMIPKSVTSLGSNAFYNCTGLLSVTCLAVTPPTVGGGVFSSSTYSNAMLFVPKASLSAYQSRNYWKNFTQMHPTLDYALNTGSTTVEFISTGNYPWTDVVEDGRVYAMSGNGGIHNSTSTLTTTVTLARAGSVTFAYKAWGEGSNYDVCVFSVDGTQKFSYGNKQNNWITYTIQLAAGTHTLEWAYSKDGSVNPTGDYFAIDNVSFTGMTVPGDIDGDGEVGIADVADLVDLILSGTATVQDYPAADVDGDGLITVADAADLLDSVLGN